jgi:hypothetical protein
MVLLASTAGAGEDSTASWEAASTVALSAATTSFTAFFSTATSATLFSIAALSTGAMSSMAFFTTVVSMTSLYAAALETAATLLAAPNVPGAATRETDVDELGRGVEAAARAGDPVGGGLLIGHPSLQSNLLLLGSGWSSSDDTSSSLRTGIATLPFPLLVLGPALGPPGPPATSTPGICTT